MSWLLHLYETYESNLDQVGVMEKGFFEEEFTLLPISHITKKSQIEVSITEDGEFHSAIVIDTNDANTIIPCTEDSSSKGSGITPHPLHDNLEYTAGDLIEYGGTSKNAVAYEQYINNLKAWAESSYKHKKIVSIYKYLSKGRLIKDLVDEKIIFLDEGNCLIKKWEKKHEDLYGEKPQLYTLIKDNVEKAFVRFNVYSEDDKDVTKVWNDPEISESFIQFYAHKYSSAEDLCFVTGKMMPRGEKHLRGIRNAGDKAKLISSNDKKGFTYRGRFDSSNEVVSIGYEVSQKAHNALKWLIHRQARIINGRVFLVWGNDELYVPNPIEDTFTLNPIPFAPERISYTYQEFANEFSKALVGRESDLELDSEVNILVLDAATQGRMGVLYYRNMNKEIYLENLINWHTTCVWIHPYRNNDQGKPFLFYGAPAAKEIASAAYGSKTDEKEVIERLIPCIVEGKEMPRDIVMNAFHRASNPLSMEKNKWEWEKTLSVACALINKQEGIGLALDTEQNDRAYLFGRLLAIADVLEKSVSDDDKRSTNAIRYMNTFSKYPARTWKIIQESLLPYQVRLGERTVYFDKLIDEVMSQFNFDNFNDEALSPKYLLGFSSQRREIYRKKDKAPKNENVDNEEVK